MLRDLAKGKESLIKATKLGVDKIIDVLSRPISEEMEDDKLKSAVDAKNQAINSIQETLVFIDEANAGEDFIQHKVIALINGCWTCFDELVNNVIPRNISEDLEDNRMKNAILAKDIARQTCQNILATIKDLDDMLNTGVISMKKSSGYKVKTIEAIAKSVNEKL